jgi:prophage antirepressor-like protein
MSIKSIIETFNLCYKMKNKKYYIDCKDLVNKLYIDKKNKLFLDETNKNDTLIEKVDGEYEVYLESTVVLKIIGQSNSHPEHYNLHKMLDIKGVTFTKKKEVETLAMIYKYFRNEYNIIYQYQFLEFKLDSYILIEIGSNGGIVIEVDENNHGNYNEQDNEERQCILESCGFHFIRIMPGMYKEKDLINKVQKEIDEFELLYTIDIDPDKLWLQLKDLSIDKDFFNFIGNSVVCNKKYCVDFEDVVEYVGYSRKDVAKKMLLENFKHNVDYVQLKYDSLKDRDDIFCPVKIRNKNQSKQGGSNKQFIFMTKFAFYSFALMAQTNKGKKVRNWIVNVYNKYQELLIYTRKRLIALKQDQNDIVTRDLYNKRQDDKTERYKKKKNRELKNMKDVKEYHEKEHKYLREICDYTKIELDDYNEIFKKQEDEIKILEDYKQDYGQFVKINNNIIKNIMYAKQLDNDSEFCKLCDKIINKVLLLDY